MWHCGSDDPAPAGATNGASGAYSGVMAGDGFTGQVKLTIGTSSSTTAALRPRAGGGTITITGTISSARFNAEITITGTYDPATQSVTFSGSSPSGAISFSGKYENGVITGDPATTPFGPVPLTLVKDLLGVRVFCAQVPAPANAAVGVFTAGDRAGLAFAVNGGARGAALGTLSGSAVSVAGGGATLAATVSGSTLSGTFTSPAGGPTMFAATEGACATLVSSVLDGGTDSGTDSGMGTDGGTDAGPPGTPQTLGAAVSPGVGYIALANGVLYYTVAHTYFSQKLEVGSIKTDGTGQSTLLPVNVPPGETRSAAGGITVANGNVFLIGGVDPPGGTATVLSLPTAGGALSTLGTFGESGFVEGAQTFASDANGLYRAQCKSPGKLFGLSFAGAAGGTVDAQIPSCAITSDGTNLFASVDGIVRVPNGLATGAQSATLVADQSTFMLNGSNALVYAIATDATHVYWGAAIPALQRSAVYRRPKDGTGTTEKLVELTGKTLRGSMAVDDTYAYFLLFTAGGQGPGGGELYRVLKTANNGTAQLVGPANLTSVVSDGSFVYYGEGTSIRKVAK